MACKAVVRIGRLLVVAALVGLPGAALGAGLTFGENGTKALSLGGAFAGQADDLTAIQHNPAGLSQLRGFHFLADIALKNHEVLFQRTESDGTFGPAQSVKNTAGPFVLPNIGLGYGTRISSFPFTAALGVYGPPAIGRYTFPTPNYDKNDRGSYENHPLKYAPQRYALIKNDLLVAYPSLSASVEVMRQLAFGVSLQYVYAHLTFSQAVYSGFATPKEQRDEDPGFDSVVSVDMTGQPQFAAIVGVMVRPIDRLSLGASARPPIPIHAKGKLTVERGEFARQLATISGDNAALKLTLPWEVKVGSHFMATRELGFNLDVVYEGWQSVQQLTLIPEDIAMKIGGAEATPLEPMAIVKKWHHTLGLRGGASYAFGFGLTARAGALFEQSASPDEYTNIDFAHLQRVFITGGVGYALGPIELSATGAFLPWQIKEVRTSEVRQATTDPTVAGGVVGNGNYTVGGWIGSLAVSGHFGGETK